MISNGYVMPTLPVTDLERARDFYEGKLGLKCVSDDEGMLVFEAGDHTYLSVYERPTPTVADQTVAEFTVDDVEATVRELQGAGVKFEEYDLPHLKTKNGIALLGDVKGAWFKDPFGNILGVGERVHETDRMRAGERTTTYA